MLTNTNTMMNQPHSKNWFLLVLLFVLTNMACGIEFASDEVQLFTGDSPVPTSTPTPTPTPPPTATLTPLPTPMYTVVPAAMINNPPQPILGAKNVSIVRFVDKDNVVVLVDGVEHTLPYATQPPPPRPQPKATPTPALEWDSRLNDLGVWVSRAQSQPGQPVYRLIKAIYEDETQSHGLHHIYVDVLDEKGQRILGQPVTQSWPSGQAVGYTENKPSPEYPLNFPMYGAQGPDSYNIYVTNAPSDVVHGLGLPASKTVNYRLTFQRQQG